jgi:hypothetical protein
VVAVVTRLGWSAARAVSTDGGARINFNRPLARFGCEFAQKNNESRIVPASDYNFYTSG